MGSKRPDAMSLLGDKAVAVEYAFHGHKRRGWYRLFQSEVTWSESIPFVSERWREAAQRKTRLFVGNGAMFGDDEICDIAVALPGFPSIDIVELARTGTHNNPSDNWRQVKAAMKEIMEECPFEILFADQAGLHAVFHTKPTRKQAKAFSDVILTVSPDVLDGVHEEVEQAGHVVPRMKDMPDFPDDEMAMVLLISELGRFRLWWD